MLLVVPVVLADTYQISWQGIVVDENGYNIASKDLNVTIRDNSTGAIIYNNTYVDAIAVGITGVSGFNVILGEEGNLTFTYNQLYNVGFKREDDPTTLWIDWKPGLGDIPGTSIDLITYVNVTVSTHTGNITNGTDTGYVAANAICNVEHTGTHFCSTDDVFDYIKDLTNLSVFSTFVTAWVTEGPPGYLSPANDCKGWTDPSVSLIYGPFWDFTDNTLGGGTGWLTGCSNSKPLACCK